MVEAAVDDSIVSASMATPLPILEFWQPAVGTRTSTPTDPALLEHLESTEQSLCAQVEPWRGDNGRIGQCLRPSDSGTASSIWPMSPLFSRSRCSVSQAGS